MVKKYYRDWKNFQENSIEFLAPNFCKSRVTFKYRNKLPSYGKLYLTNDNKSFFIKLTKRKDVDKVETYFKRVLYMMANKPMEKEKEEKKEEKKDIEESTKTESINVEEQKQEKGKEKEEKEKNNTNESDKKKQNKYKNKKNKKGKK